MGNIHHIWDQRWKPVRYGVIGCGDMGQVHAMNYLQSPHLVRTVAICDVVDANINTMQGILGEAGRNARVVTDYRQLLAMDDVEAVIVATPNRTHLPIVLEAFAAGKHVFCEKPMAVDLQHCVTMIEAWRKTNLVFQIGLVYRYSPLFREMRRLIEEGRIGDPCLAWCHEFREPFPIGRGREWRYSETASGGALVEKDCHHFDLFNWMLGVQPVRVQAMGGQLAIKRDQSGDMEPGVSGEPYPASLMPHPEILDHAWVNLEYTNGAKANLGLCFFAPDYELPVGVLGTRGRVVANVHKETLELMVYDRNAAKHQTEQFHPESKIIGFGQIGHPGGFDQHIEFCRCVRTGEQAFCGGQIGMESLLPAFAGQKSIAQSGRVVEIDELWRDVSRSIAPEKVAS